MSESTEWIDEKYRQVYEEEALGLLRRKEHDPSFSVSDASGILRSFYIMDGNNWDGRGQVNDVTLSATIAAYEDYIAQIKKEAVK